MDLPCLCPKVDITKEVIGAVWYDKWKTLALSSVCVLTGGDEEDKRENTKHIFVHTYSGEDMKQHTSSLNK